MLKLPDDARFATLFNMTLEGFREARADAYARIRVLSEHDGEPLPDTDEGLTIRLEERGVRSVVLVDGQFNCVLTREAHIRAIAAEHP